jgi:tetratricopeptide (TPR) repeat protein
VIRLLLVVALLASGCAGRSPSQRELGEWLPLTPGVRWVYDAERRDALEAGGETSERVTRDVRVEGIEREGEVPASLLWAVYDAGAEGLDRLRAPAGTARRLLRQGPGVFELAEPPPGAEGRSANGRLLLPFDPRPGQRWQRPAELAGQATRLRVEVLGFEDVTTPAGPFRGCLSLRLSGSLELAEAGGAPVPLRFEGREWYALGVGPVKRVHTLERAGATPEGSPSRESSVSTLVLRDRFVEPPERRSLRAARSPRAQEARRIPRQKLAALLREERFDELEKRLLELEVRHARGDLSSDALSLAYASFVAEDLARLERWVEQRPDSHVARAVRGVHQHRWGWQARGNGALRDTTAEQLAAMDEAFERALADHRAALEAKPDFVVSLRDLLRIAQVLGDFDDERGVFERLVELESDPLVAYRLELFGLDPRWGGSPGAMLALADEALARHGDGELAQRVRAEVLATTALVFERPGSKDLARAEQLWDQAVAAGPEWRGRRGAFLARAGRLREALADLDGHMKSSGSDADTLQARGRLFQRLGWLPLARADFEAGLKLAPRDAGLHEDLARLEARLGESERALVHWDLAVEAAPRDTTLWMGRGALLAQLGQTQEALRSLERAVELQPGDPRPQLRLAELLRSAGDPRALAAFRRYVDLAHGRPEHAASRAAAEVLLATPGAVGLGHAAR